MRWLLRAREERARDDMPVKLLTVPLRNVSNQLPKWHNRRVDLFVSRRHIPALPVLSLGRVFKPVVVPGRDPPQDRYFAQRQVLVPFRPPFQRIFDLPLAP